LGCRPGCRSRSEDVAADDVARSSPRRRERGVVVAAGVVTGLFVAGPGALGCAPAPTLLVAADADRDDAPGRDGPFGALLVARTVRVRGDRPVDVDVVAPTVDDTTVADGPFLPVLLVQGGSVPVERYHWLAQHIASRGFVVVAPHHALDLAFFSQGDGLDALAAVRRLGDPSPSASSADPDLGGRVAEGAALAIGHSLGGVVASNAFAGDPGGVTHLALLSAVPNPGVDVGRTDGRVLSLAGARDGLITVDEVVEGAAAFRATTTVAVVDDLTHFQLTDAPTDENLRREGTTSPLAPEEVRPRALFLVDAMLFDLQHDARGVEVLDHPERWPAGLRLP
jgi:pimeloyl-ACP methyl ester carboxylesterase